tara:strand:+ start:481 stop:738 length:258 start_codon:yes stop_codon:yes gene_type:complete
MPRYSFACKSCSVEFEEFVRFEDIEGVACPHCNSKVDRSYNFCGSKVERSKSEMMEQIKEDAKAIAKKIKNGDQNAISEIYGGEK